MTIEVISMKSAAITQLKAKLSHYLKQVQAGEEVLVLNRGKPIARIVPIDPDSDLAHDAWIQELIRTGRLKPAKGKLPADFWERELPKDMGDSVLKALLEEREEGR